MNTTEDDDRFTDDFVEQEVREAANERAAPSPVDDCVRFGTIEQRSRGRVEGALKLFAESFALIVIPRARLDELLRDLTREPEIQSLGLHATLNFFERERGRWIREIRSQASVHLGPERLRKRRSLEIRSDALPEILDELKAFGKRQPLEFFRSNAHALILPASDSPGKLMLR